MGVVLVERGDGVVWGVVLVVVVMGGWRCVVMVVNQGGSETFLGFKGEVPDLGGREPVNWGGGL